MILNKITSIIKYLNKDIYLFIISNLLYSLMVFVLNVLFPLLFEEDIFIQVVYIFQMIIVVNSLSNFGISTGLLRNSVLDKQNTLRYALLSIFIIQSFIFILSFFKNNLITQALNINGLTFIEHLFLYFSVISINIYFYNRSIMNSEKKFKLMIRHLIFVVLVRISSLISLVFFIENTLSNILLFIFIIPFSLEYVFLFKKIANYKFHEFIRLDKKYFYFLFFSFKVFIGGALFVLSDRFMLIKMKEYDNETASLLAFSFGFLGVVSVINYSFQNYFLNRIDPNSKESIFSFLKKIKKYFPHYFLIMLIGTLVVCSIVYILYVDFDLLIYPIIIILIFKTAITSYLGFKNILITSLDLLKYAIVINALRLLLVAVSLLFLESIGFISTLLLISLVMIMCELILNKIVDKNLNLKYE